MSYICFRCSKEVNLDSPTAVGRRDTCPHCNHDLHICKNCLHYDKSAYNECREPQAERVLEKESSNFCDYFSFSAKGQAAVKNEKTASLKSLDDLFKK